MSDFAEQWKAIKHPEPVLPVGEYLAGSDGESLPRLRIRVLSKWDDIEGVAAAVKAHEQWQRDQAFSIKGYDDDNHDTLELFKAAERVWRAFRTESGDAAFFTPRWVLEEFDSAQLAMLLNLYDQAKVVKNPDAYELDADVVRGIRDALSAAVDTDMPAADLAKYDPTYMVNICLLMARMWKNDADRLAMLERAQPEQAASADA